MAAGIIRRILPAALALLAACSGEPKAEGDGAPTRVPLWELSDATGVRGWIFGTVHALPEGTRWRRAEVDAALGSADRLVLEIGEPIESDVASRALQKLALTPGLPPPSQRIAPAFRDDLAAAYRDLDLADTDFGGAESWAVALQIAAIAGRKHGADPENGVEQQLRELAVGKRVAGLETIEGQFAVFDALPPRQQTVLLEQVAAEAASGQTGEDDMLALWLKGDELGLSRETGTGFLADPALRGALLTARNRAWADKVDAMLKGGARPFIAVGAAHVVGRDGLPRMLEARGWRVRRVP